MLLSSIAADETAKDAAAKIGAGEEAERTEEGKQSKSGSALSPSRRPGEGFFVETLSSGRRRLRFFVNLPSLRSDNQWRSREGVIFANDG
ncbi:hypothetical protein KSP39_PZI013734 [Platanthera zijinensis]|uniref:Uncharacterized protein n=1 Tax=Platanthera zijinensis TaxID=2320716 RepID=A0AAP0BDB0_9ASPA